jgi:hypothetical protein
MNPRTLQDYRDQTNKGASVSTMSRRFCTSCGKSKPVEYGTKFIRAKSRYHKSIFLCKECNERS